ncbi:bifunctional K Homology domain [Babesia duncani]|uniref:Bifunctional K Homology domain n=1 Tax=Babesia duncani TaxID=323732 RepID=A0AAD9UM88_9APIC|nr:bifunctional K Homology domain [Babesia duncani]KAK2194965.1 bifunctional K Homology domain [Babesia duncani]
MNPMMYGGMIPPQYQAAMGMPYGAFDPSKMSSKNSQMPTFTGTMADWIAPMTADKFYQLGGAPGFVPYPTKGGHFPMNAGSGARADEMPISNGTHWNAAVMPPLNTYANTRLAVFVENPQYNYELIESDLRELFSYYSGVHGLSIMPEYPAAELILSDVSSCNLAAQDLNGIVINGVGTIRCVVMQPGQILNTLIPAFQIPAYGIANSLKQHQPAYNNNTTAPRSKRSLVEHVPGISTLPNVRRVCRFELVDLFTYEPDFNVAAVILGPSNKNIEYIMTTTSNKVDLSITGKPLNSASVAERLHVSIDSVDFEAYDKAIELVEFLLTTVCEKYVNFVRKRGKIVSNLVGYKRHEYELQDGELEYKGCIDKPKTWLETGRRSRNSGGGRSLSRSNNNTSKYQKRVNERHRTISHRNSSSNRSKATRNSNDSYSVASGS